MAAERPPPAGRQPPRVQAQRGGWGRAAAAVVPLAVAPGTPAQCTIDLIAAPTCTHNACRKLKRQAPAAPQALASAGGSSSAAGAALQQRERGVQVAPPIDEFGIDTVAFDDYRDNPPARWVQPSHQAGQGGLQEAKK